MSRNSIRFNIQIEQNQQNPRLNVFKNWNVNDIFVRNFVYFSLFHHKIWANLKSFSFDLMGWYQITDIFVFCYCFHFTPFKSFLLSPSPPWSSRIKTLITLSDTLCMSVYISSSAGWWHLMVSLWNGCYFLRAYRAAIQDEKENIYIYTKKVQNMWIEFENRKLKSFLSYTLTLFWESSLKEKYSDLNMNWFYSKICLPDSTCFECRVRNSVAQITLWFWYEFYMNLNWCYFQVYFSFEIEEKISDWTKNQIFYAEYSDKQKTTDRPSK